jgi:hypothetical protein
MPFCASCGTQAEGKFCPKCGAAIVAGGAAPPPSVPGASAAPVASAPMAENVASTLCYVLGLITGIIFLVLEPYSKNRTVRFHAFQSIFLNVAVIVIEIIMVIVFRILIEFWGSSVSSPESSSRSSDWHCSYCGFTYCSPRTRARQSSFR